MQRFYSKTGGLVAISGGRDFKDVVNRNQATDPHPTGSSLKPFLAYGPAIENMKWATNHAIQDHLHIKLTVLHLETMIRRVTVLYLFMMLYDKVSISQL